ncbi:MAG: tetratricopeptide repeat protein [Deltaproteobacteria bacterium]
MANPSQSPPRPAQRESVGGVMRDVLVLGALLLAGLVFYYRHVQTSKEVNHVSKQAKDLADKDTPKDFAKAEQDLDHVLSLDPKNGYALSSHAELDALLWGEDGVLAKKADALDYSQRADAVDAHIQERYAADALVLLYGDHPADAEQFLVSVINRGAHGAQIFDALGRAQRRLGKLDMAQKSLSEAAKSSWRNPRFNADLGQLYFDLGDSLNALVYFQKALESNPDHPRSLIGRARAGIARGEKIKVATDDLASLLGPRKDELTPSLLALAYTARAELKLFGHQWPEALRDAQAAVAADRNCAPAREVVGRALAHGQPQKALDAFDKALALDPYPTAFYFSSARALLDAGLADKAVSMMQRYGKVLSKDEHYYLFYGDLLDRKGDKAGALAQLELALKANPFSAAAWYAKGRILQGEHKYPEAGKAYEAALGAQENFPEVHQQMAYMLLDAKKAVDAAGEFEQALELFKADQAPRTKLVALRDDFAKRFKKAPRPLQKKFWDDAKVILH